MTTGQEVQGVYPFKQRPVDELLSRIPTYLSQIIGEYRQVEHSAIHRFWIEAEAIKVHTHIDKKTQCTNLLKNGMRH